MLLSLVVHTYSLRYWLPATFMLGSAPAYLLSWGAWRLLSTLLPAKLYHKWDDRLYCIYQSMVLFFFENYTGVEVSKLFFYSTSTRNGTFTYLNLWVDVYQSIHRPSVFKKKKSLDTNQ